MSELDDLLYIKNQNLILRRICQEYREKIKEINNPSFTRRFRPQQKSHRLLPK